MYIGALLYVARWMCCECGSTPSYIRERHILVFALGSNVGIEIRCGTVKKL